MQPSEGSGVNKQQLERAEMAVTPAGKDHKNLSLSDVPTEHHLHANSPEIASEVPKSPKRKNVKSVSKQGRHR